MSHGRGLNLPPWFSGDDLGTAAIVSALAGAVLALADGSISIPVFEEQLVVEKRLVVRERVILRKHTVVEEQRVTADLRRERVVVEADESVIDRVHPAAGRPPSGSEHPRGRGRAQPAR